MVRFRPQKSLRSKRRKRIEDYCRKVGLPIRCRQRLRHYCSPAVRAARHKDTLEFRRGYKAGCIDGYHGYDHEVTANPNYESAIFRAGYRGGYKSGVCQRHAAERRQQLKRDQQPRPATCGTDNF